MLLAVEQILERFCLWQAAKKERPAGFVLQWPVAVVSERAAAFVGAVVFAVVALAFVVAAVVLLLMMPLSWTPRTILLEPMLPIAT